MMMTGTINGRSFMMDEVASEEIVRLNDLEIWEFYNSEGGGMGMMWPDSLFVQFWRVYPDSLPGIHTPDRFMGFYFDMYKLY